MAKFTTLNFLCLKFLFFCLMASTAEVIPVQNSFEVTYNSAHNITSFVLPLAVANYPW